MAQNEIKKYETPASFHNDVRYVLQKFNSVDSLLEDLSDFLSTSTSGDYPNSPLTDLDDLRTAMTAYFGATEYTALKAEVDNFIRIK